MILSMLIPGRGLTTSHSPDGIIETCCHGEIELILGRGLTTSHSPDGIIETCCHSELELIFGRDLTTSHSPDGIIETCCHSELELILGRDLTTSRLHAPYGVRPDHVSRELGRDEGFVRETDDLGVVGENCDFLPIQVQRHNVNDGTLPDTRQHHILQGNSVH